MTLVRDYVLGCIRFYADALSISADHTADWAQSRLAVPHPATKTRSTR